MFLILAVVLVLLWIGGFTIFHVTGFLILRIPLAVILAKPESPYSSPTLSHTSASRSNPHKQKRPKCSPEHFGLFV